MKKLIEKIQTIFKDIKVEEFMNKNIIVISPDKSLLHAKEIMRLKRISGIPVVTNENKLVGIISIEDIIKALENGYIEDKIEKRMTKNVIVLKPGETLEKVVAKFDKYKFGRFPVVDEDFRVVGIVTKLDILRALLEKLATIHLHDRRKKRVLESEHLPDIVDRSLLTGEQLNKTKADFAFKIDYNDISMIGVGAAKLKRFLLDKKFPQSIVRKVSIATYEAEANVVIHSKSEGYIYCFLRNNSIVVRVEDFGKGIENIEIAMKEGYSTVPDEIRELGFGAGMGLPNMKRFSDKMMIISEKGKGTIVEMSFFLRRNEK